MSVEVKRIALLAGGYTGERDVAILSGEHIEQILKDDNDFEAYLIKVGKDGWFYDEPLTNQKIQVNKEDFSIILTNHTKIKFDVAMLLMGGPPGEDGQIQGYLQLLQIPYVGCGILASGMTYNKSIANRVVRSLNSSFVNVSRSIDINSNSSDYDVSSLRLPLIVKPVDSGSSLGVSKVNHLSQLPQALSNAFIQSNEAIVEEFIIGREITVGVVRLHGKIDVLPITEIIHPNQDAFFDSTAKFIGETGTQVVTPADLNEQIKTNVERGVTQLYEKLYLSGLVRIDMIIQQSDSKIYFLEVNAAPSQTEYSIIIKQLAQAGWNNDQLREFYKQLIQSSF